LRQFSTADWPCYWLRSVTSLVPQRWGGFAVSCHSPYCAHQYCVSVALDQIETTFLDFLHPLIWLSVNHVSLSNLSCQLSNMLTFATIILTLSYVTHYFLPLYACTICIHYMHLLYEKKRILVTTTPDIKYYEHCKRYGEFYEVTHCMKIEQLYSHTHLLGWHEIHLVVLTPKALAC